MCRFIDSSGLVGFFILVFYHLELKTARKARATIVIYLNKMQSFISISCAAIQDLELFLSILKPVQYMLPANYLCNLCKKQIYF